MKESTNEQSQRMEESGSLENAQRDSLGAVPGESPQPIPITITEPGAAQLSEDGHWAETQVIQSIKDANLRHKSPQRVLRGTATMPLGGIHHPVIGDLTEGRLVTPRPRLRTRVKRMFKILRS